MSNDDGLPPDDEDEKKKKNGKSKVVDPSALDRESARGPVSPVNEELFNFLDGLFTGEGEFPERIEVRTVKGRNRDQYGLQIMQRAFKTDAVKPSRERIVMLCNEIILRVRQQADVLQRDTVFMVGAVHHGRSDDFYEIMQLTVKPKKTWQRGEKGDLDVDDDEPFANRYNTKMLDHFTEFFGLLGGMVEGLLNRSDQQANSYAKDADNMRARYIEMLETNLRLVQAEDERKEKIADAKMWREQKMKGLDFAWGQLPPMLSAFKKPDANANWKQGDESHEAYTLREMFFKEGGPLTREELSVICGNLDDKGDIITPGILKIEQVALLAQVAKKEITPDALYELLEGGQFELTTEQAGKLLGSGISLMKLMPLKTLLDVLTAKRAQRQNNGKGET